jgi:hypothetical protein
MHQVRVFVTWWERNATSEEPLLRTSTDKGATFGPIMKMSAIETIDSISISIRLLDSSLFFRLEIFPKFNFASNGEV